MAKIEAGTVLAFCGGEYSDKWTTGPFNVLRDFDQREAVDAFRAQFKPEHQWDEPSEDRFIAWLTANGYIVDAPKSFSWYVGSYGDFTPVISPDAP